QFRGGIGATIFLLGALVVAATAAPAAAGAAGISELAVSGLGTLRPARAAALTLAMLSLAGAPPMAGFFGEFTIGAALARTGHLELLAVGLLGSLLSLVAAIGTVRVLYLQNPPDEGRRGLVALPVAVITISAVGLLGTGGTIGVVDYFAGDLPSIDQLQSSKLEQTTRIVDRNGNLIAAVYHENRTVVPLSKISKNLQAATIDTEDRTFYSNSGV